MSTPLTTSFLVQERRESVPRLLPSLWVTHCFEGNHLFGVTISYLHAHALLQWRTIPGGRAFQLREMSYHLTFNTFMPMQAEFYSTRPRHGSYVGAQLERVPLCHFPNLRLNYITYKVTDFLPCSQLYQMRVLTNFMPINIINNLICCGGIATNSCSLWSMRKIFNLSPA